MSARFRAYVRQHHLALLALFVALGGTSYAAIRIPASSVGSRQIRNNAVSSPKVKDRSLLAKDFKSGQIPAGPRGATGVTGPTGARGPGTFTLDGQFDYNGQSDVRTLPLGNNLELLVLCSVSGTTTDLNLRATNAGQQSFYGWGTASDGTTLRRATSDAADLYSSNPGSAASELDGVAHSTTAGQLVRYTRVDASVIKGSQCNYHVLVTPPG